MTTGTYLISILSIVLIITFMILNNNLILFSLEKSTDQTYVFVAKWGSKGTEDGQFAGLRFAPDSVFIITDKTIEILKDKITDNKKLEKIQSLKNMEFNYYDEILGALDTLKLDLTFEETWTILEESALSKLSNEEVNGPLDIDVDKSGYIYVPDFYNYRIQKFDTNGKFITKWGDKGSNDGQFDKPKKIAIDQNGNIYVVDYGNYCIQEFDTNGNFITKWGKQCEDWDEKDGKDFFHCVSNIAIDLEGNILLKESDYIKKFNSEGDFQGIWLELIRNKKQLDYAPGYGTVLDIDSLNNIYISFWKKVTIVTDDDRKRNTFGPGLVKFTSEGEFIKEWDKNSSIGKHFRSIKDLTIDLEGNIFILNTEENCIQKFNFDGDLLTQFGSKGSNDGQFLYPEAIAVDSKGNVYVMDTGNYRIQKFAPVP